MTKALFMGAYITITLKDIAKKSGYGYGTVARALSNNPYLVKEETRNKIIAIAEKHAHSTGRSSRCIGCSI